MTTTQPRARRTPPVLRGDVEGLRAVAVGTVVVYHVAVPALGPLPELSGGFIGVDVFFVISGFLITSLLLKEADRTGRVGLAGFYARRARRLLPAAITVIVATVVAGYLALPRTEHRNLVTDALASTFYVENWALALRSVDYLAEDAAPSPLQHFWSLAVEEQFYIVWPLVILLGLLVARRIAVPARTALLAVLVLVTAASLVTSLVQTGSNPGVAYFATTTRAWELGIGAVLAFLVTRLRDLPRPVAQAMAAVGILMVLVSAVAFDASTPWPSGWALVPTVGAALVIAAGCSTQETVTARLLGTAPMRWIGGLSYAIYLWHWPVLVLAEAAAGEQLQLRYRILLGLSSIGLAWLTKHLVEDPIRFRPWLTVRPARSLVLGLALTAVSVSAAGALLATVPTTVTTGETPPGAAALVADPGAGEWTVRADPEAAVDQDGPVQPDPVLATEDIPTYYDDDCQVPPGDTLPLARCAYGDTGSDRTIALLGDSKMGQWFPALEAISTAEDTRLELYLKSACSFSLRGGDEDCRSFVENTLRQFEAEGAPDVAIVSQGGSGAERAAGTTEALRRLEALGTEVVVLADSASPPDGVKVYECVADDPDDLLACGYDRADADGRGTPALRTAARALDLPFVDLNAWTCPAGLEECPAVIGGTLVYRQGSHVTATWVRTLSPVLHRELSRVGATRTPVADISVDDVPADGRR